MARHATLPDSLMLKDKRPSLRGVALETSFVLTQESKTAAFERLLNIGAATFDCHSDVRVMAISTTDLAFQYWMVMRQLKTCAHLEMTLETRLR